MITSLVLTFVSLAVPAAEAPKCLSDGCQPFTTAAVVTQGAKPPPMVAANLSSPSSTAPAPPAEPPPVESPPPARLGVIAREWSLVLSRTTLPAGAALIELQNQGEDAHNLRIERTDGSGAPVDVPEAESGEVKSAAATLPAGDYRLYCALPGHESAGMRAKLTVSGG